MRHHRIFGVENGRNGTDERWSAGLFVRSASLEYSKIELPCPSLTENPTKQ
jgi:hypothetical protein